MTTTRTRPAAAPAYYLGRPADAWRTALRRRINRPTSTIQDRDVAPHSGAMP